MILLPALVLGVLGAGLIVAGVAVGRRRFVVGAPIALLGIAGLAGAVAILVFAKAFAIPSENMVPTLQIDDRIATLDAGDVSAGDIIAYHPPAGAVADDGPRCGRAVPEGELCHRAAGGRSGVTFVGRVVAVGGDELRLVDGNVIRNDQPADEPYARPCGDGAGCDFAAPIRIPRGQVYVLGDNRGAADDSRFWGPVREDWIVGRVVWRYWPLKRFGAP